MPDADVRLCGRAAEATVDAAETGLLAQPSRRSNRIVAVTIAVADDVIAVSADAVGQTRAMRRVTPNRPSRCIYTKLDAECDQQVTVVVG